MKDMSLVFLDDAKANYPNDLFNEIGCVWDTMALVLFGARDAGET